MSPHRERSGRVVVFISLILFSCSTVFGDDDFKNCFRYTSFGYGYKDFFEFLGGNSSSNYIFVFDFYVKAVSDAHVLLKSEESGEDLMEVVIGGGSNTFSQIRIMGKRRSTFAQRTENILSDVDYKKFQISIDKLGTIFVRQGDNVILNWKFETIFPIRYFAFGSWTNTKADWRFGCDHVKDIVPEEGEMTALERLKNDLFTLYNPNTVPNGLSSTLEVRVNLEINKIQLNERRGELTMHGFGVLKWQDLKMQWKPKDYGGIEHLFIPPFQIWTPYLRILNALGMDKSPVLDLTAAGVVVTHEGKIFWRPPFKSVSSCMVDLGNWPYDVHNCSVLIGFWMEPPNLRLTISEEYDLIKGRKAGSEWNIIGAMSFNGRRHDENDNYGILYVELERNENSPLTILSAPLMAARILSLSSFWISSDNPCRFYLSCGSVIIILIILLVLGQLVPTVTPGVPRIIAACSWSVILACIPILAFIILKNIPKDMKLSGSTERLLNYSLLDEIFCLPEPVPQNASDYGNLIEDANKPNKEHTDAARLITIVERCLFLTYLILLLLHLYLV